MNDIYDGVRRISKRFKEMPIGEVFECWGDADLDAYNYPKICLMIKDSSYSAKEVDSGVSHCMCDGNYDVIIPLKVDQALEKYENN